MSALAIRLSMLGLAFAPAALHAQQMTLDRSAFRLLHLEGHGVRWKPTGEGRPPVVTYAIADDNMRFDGARNCGAITPVAELLSRSRIERRAFEAELREAFAMWEQTANIRFEPVANPTDAGIVIGAQAQPEGRAYANVFHSRSADEVRAIERSLVCLNPTIPWKIGFDGNIDVYDLRYTLAHEIGHAIGLDHPTASGALMSFRYEERFRELQPGDIEGAVALYGRRIVGLTGEAAAASKP